MTKDHPKQAGKNSKKMGWHRILARIWQEWLTPVEIIVQPDIPVMTDPLEADILLLRREGNQWNAAQKERLPDGIRESKASHILVEFTATESVNEFSILQIEGYDYQYLRSQKLQRSELQSFLISSKNRHKRKIRGIFIKIIFWSQSSLFFYKSPW